MNKLLTIILLLTSISCHAEGLFGSLNYATTPTRSGAEVELGFQKSFDSININLVPLSGIFYNDKNSRYQNETFKNGKTICRDKSNGQFSNKENCDGNFEYAALTSIDYSINEKFNIGVGARINEDRESTAFATARYKLTSTISVNLKYGNNYQSIGVAIGI
jgi:hypothetical protein